jgi:hypothetical protein
MVSALEASHITLAFSYLLVSIKGTHLPPAHSPVHPFPTQTGSGQKLLNVGGYK